MKKIYILLITIIFSLSSFGQNILTSKYETWSGENWVNWIKYDYTYDANGFLKNYIFQIWDENTNSWENRSQDIYFNNSNGLVQEYISQKWNNFIFPYDWTNSNRINYTYNGDNKKLTKTTEIWYEDWVMYNKTNFTYDGNGFLTNTLTEYWDKLTNTWENITHVIYINNNNGTLQEDIYQIWDETTNSWTNSWSSNYTYNESNKTLTTTSKVWDETTNSWTNSKGSNYTYNENNKLLTTTSKVWDETFPGGKWLIYEKSTNTYDENGFLINNFTKTWDKSTATWINYSRIYYKNYINGLVHKFKQQYWDNIKNCWNNTQQGTFTYTNTTEIIKESNDFSINLYPNPCKEYINLDISNELNSNVEIIDLQGKVVFNKSINENYLSIDLRNFPVNIYFLKIQQGDKSIIKKFIKN